MDKNIKKALRSLLVGGNRRSVAFVVVSVFLLVILGPPGTSIRAEDEFVLAVHPYLPASELAQRFDPLARYLAGKLGRPVRVDVSLDYAAHIERVGRDEVDIAYLGPASFVRMIGRHGDKPILARLEVEGRPTFHGHIVVRKDSPFTTLADLIGKRFAFGDPDSTMGSLVPLHMLHEAGVHLAGLAGYGHLSSHNDVALGVLMGRFDAGAVKEEVYHEYRERGLRSLAATPAIPEHVFVTRSTLPPGTVTVLREAMLGLKDASVLRALKKTVTGLVPASNADYDNLRAILATVDTLTRHPGGR